MKKRVIKISAIVVGILIIGWFGIYFLLPRIMLYKMVKDYLPNIDKSAEYFTDFSIASNGSVITVNNEYISLKIPSNYHRQTTKYELADIYRSFDDKETVFFMKEPDDLSPMNLLCPENYEDIEDIPNELGIKEITQGFKSLGNGVPDSAYNTYKCMCLVDRDDYSFWDIKKGTCFAIIAFMKEILVPRYDEIFLYEKDNIRGIVCVTHNYGENEFEYVLFNFFNSNDLNTAYSVQIVVGNLDDAYAVINSAEFI